MFGGKPIFHILVLDGHPFGKHFEKRTTATMAHWQSSSSFSDYQNVRVINRDPNSSRSGRTTRTVKTGDAAPRRYIQVIGSRTRSNTKRDERTLVHLIDDGNVFRPVTNHLNDSSDTPRSSINDEDDAERTFNEPVSYKPVHTVIKVVHRDPKLARAQQRFRQQAEQRVNVTLSDQENRSASKAKSTHSFQRSDDDNLEDEQSNHYSVVDEQKSDSRLASGTKQRNHSATTKFEDKEMEETMDDIDVASVSFLSSNI